MINNFPKVQEYYSFKSDQEEYNLFLVDQSVVSRFHHLLTKIESQSQTILCTRGDAKESHYHFFQEDLNKIFTVGEKSRYHFSENVKNIYLHTYTENKTILEKELRDLIQKVNQAMNRREREFSLKTLEYFIDLEFDKFDIELLLKLKVFFLSFLHTDGREEELSSTSPFLSVTYGNKKFSIARKFALGKKNPKKRAFIYLYSLNAGDPYYMKTNILSKKLQQEGAKWHYDKYKEILLINGMFPHYMLGIFEVEINRTPRFIMNPYLYEVLK